MKNTMLTNIAAGLQKYTVDGVRKLKASEQPHIAPPDPKTCKISFDENSERSAEYVFFLYLSVILPELDSVLLIIKRSKEA